MSASEPVALELLPLLRKFVAGPYAIALGGSHVKGTADSLSDIDIYLFAEQVLPSARRDELVTEALGSDARPESWGSDDPFVEGGTDFWHTGQRAECWLRRTSRVEAALQACLEGQVGREYRVWTVMGFFEHTVLADLHSLHIVDDPHRVLARWQESVAVYPEALRSAIIRRFMAAAAFWPENLHYRTAVERADLIYTSAIVQQVVQALIQVVFALNRVYFPGEKHLAPATAKLPIQPADLPARLHRLLAPPGTDTAGLEGQRRELAALVEEVRLMADAERAASR